MVYALSFHSAELATYLSGLYSSNNNVEFLILIGERGFANRSFSYISNLLYNKLLITVKQIDSLNTFKSHLKGFLFSLAYNGVCSVISLC